MNDFVVVKVNGAFDLVFNILHRSDRSFVFRGLALPRRKDNRKGESGKSKSRVRTSILGALFFGRNCINLLTMHVSRWLEFSCLLRHDKTSASRLRLSCVWLTSMLDHISQPRAARSYIAHVISPKNGHANRKAPCGGRIRNDRGRCKTIKCINCLSTRLQETYA